MSEPIERLSAALAEKYRLEREIGAGGMATVYLAHDLKHNRKVAIKVLRPELAAILGADRFLKEIEVTANLQHPNILPLYDSGQADTFLYYAMPFVEGESLRAKIDREKQLGVTETVRIIENVSAALTFAHERGVVHRDIKPENILLQSGQALVADFGIALAVSQVGGSRLTDTGLSVGTPQYMSPEQASGDRDPDARSDVYSLGAVTYEMLTGDPPHSGSTVQAIIAKILTEKPIPVNRTRDAVPPNVNAAVLTALEKTPADRFSSAVQFAEALTNPSFTSAVVRTVAPEARGGQGVWNRLSITMTVVAAAAVLVSAFLLTQRGGSATASASVVRAVIQLPEDQRLTISGAGSYPLALSRDGTKLVYLGTDGTEALLFLHQLDDQRVLPLPGTEGASHPFFSPDGEWVGFFADDKLQRVSISGGAPLLITEAPGRPFGASWGEDGSILYRVIGSDFQRVATDGTEPVEVPMAVVADDVRGRWPQLLPDGRHALITTTWGPSQSEGSSVGVLDLETGELRPLVAGSQGRYLPTGHLLYYEPGELVRLVPFDLDRLEVSGLALPAFENVFRGPNGGAANFAVSETGTLVYRTGGFERSIVLVDRDGRETPLDVEPKGYRFPAISPDGNRVLLTVDPRPSDIWLLDLGRTTLTRITTEGHHVVPIWAPDGERIAFTVRGGPHWTRWRDVTEPVPVTDRPPGQFGQSWTQDDWIIAHEQQPETGWDLILLGATADTVRTFLATPADEAMGRISPDGEWVTYVSNVSGNFEVYVLPYRRTRAAPSRVSVGGGTDARWSRDGTELFYRRGNTIVAVAVSAGRTFSVGPPQDLLSGPYDFTQSQNWDVGTDGRFLMIKGDASSNRELQVVVNWFEEVKAKFRE